MDLVEMERDCSVTPEANRMAPVTETKKKKTNKKKKSNQKRTSRRTTAAAPPPSATPLVGSLTMWNVPPGAPPLKEDIAFSTVSFLSIVEDYTERKQKQASTAEKLSVVDLFVIHILQNLRRLRGLMLSGKLTIDIEYGVVKAVRGETTNDPVNKELLARISTMRPYTISWSNVLDYFMPEDFHDLARRCSIHGDCVHYGYSMNWPTQVLGASIMDFDFKHNRQLIDHVLDAALGFPNSSKTLSVSNLLTLMGMDKLVTFPFHENPLNSTGCVLAYIFHDKWIAHFLSKGRLSPEVAERLGSLCTPVNCGLQKGSMELSIPSPLDHTSTTLHMSWTYDPELRMHRENAPVETSAEMDVLSGLLYSMGVTERQRFLDAMTADSSS
ncbi:hypothetical protein PHYBOEH_001059 [Phytophthora boehmeriae]|uniref:Uncharacterized protein n=1 Tax=Phytophthora boehmeriae TaxID=109152 RepID=A0A8T1WTV6_9STRA|nr:hypothetical protein PHYBOEH_001059 [Phytophthora boehmeriae]